MQNARLDRLMKSLPVVICSCLFAQQAAEAAVNASGIDGKRTSAPRRSPPVVNYSRPDSQTIVSKHHIGGLTIEDASTPLAGISATTVRMGRELYKELRRAQEASAEHDEIDTRLALNNASNVVNRLYTPSEVQALRRQTSIIREDLKQQGKPLDKALWLPLDAQLDQLKLLLPRQGYKAATAALDKARSAVKQSDRTKAGLALDQIEESLTRHYALMPLGTIRSDLRSARDALDPYPPYWEGITEATGSALASIRWISTVHAKGWISAYLTAIEAGNELPDHPEMAQQLLRRTALSLAGDGAGDLHDLAEDLSDNSHPSARSVDKLIAAIGKRVRML